MCDVYMYTVLIDSFCKTCLIQNVSKWLLCSLNVVTYTAIRPAYLKARKTV